MFGDRSYISIGNHVQVAAEMADGGGSDSDRFHLAGKAVDIDNIANGNVTLHPQENAGDHIFYKRLRAKANGDAANPGHRDHGGYVYPENAQNNRNQDKVHGIVENADNQRAEGFALTGAARGRTFAPLNQPVNQPSAQTNAHRAQQHNQRGQQQFAEPDG